MMMAVVLNTVLALGFLITVLFCVGDVTAAVSTPTGFPIIQILYQATGSRAGATVITCMILFSTMIALFGVFASVSRLTWAFAKDNGLPFSEFFARVSFSDPLAQWRNINWSVSSSLIRETGPSDVAHPSQCSSPCHHHRGSSRSHQHRQHHRLQRHLIARDHGLVSVLRHAPGLRLDAQITRAPPIVRSVSIGRLEHTRQHCRSGFWDFHGHLPAVSQRPAGDCRHDELRRAYPRICHAVGARRLVHQRTGEVRSANPCS